MVQLKAQELEHRDRVGQLKGQVAWHPPSPHALPQLSAPYRRGGIYSPNTWVVPTCWQHSPEQRLTRTCSHKAYIW